jgi:uncharacterized membrane protein YjjP (DUF1212 family)
VAALAELMSRLARLLLVQGITCDRMERVLEGVAAAQGLQAEINATPTSIFFSLGDGEATVTRMVRANPESPDYHKLDGLLRLLEKLERRAIGLREASVDIDAIASWPPRHGAAVRLLATLILSASSAVLLNLGWREIAMASLLGLAAGSATALKRSWQGPGEAIPVLAAVAAAFLAFAAARLGIPIHPVPLLVAGLVSFLPGLQMTAAMSELASGHWVAGSSRLVAGGTRLLLLVLGGITGEALASSMVVLSPGAAAHTHALSPGWLVAPLLAGLAFAVIRSGDARDRGWVVAICYLAILSARLATPVLGSTGGAFVGAFCTVMVSNALTRWTRRPALAIGAPAILLLVPGVMGFMSLSSVLLGDVSETVRTLVQMLMISVSLSLGGMLATLIVAPRRLI